LVYIFYHIVPKNIKGVLKILSSIPVPYNQSVKRLSKRDIEKNRALYEYLEVLLEDELSSYLEWLLSPHPSALRINTLKISKEKLLERLKKKGFEIEPIEFYEEGYRIKKSSVEPGKTLEHYLGYYYIQDVASMAPAVVLDPEPGDKVLDLAAAPGSKTTQMAQMMKNRGVIVANDISYERIKALSHNIDRLGVLNTIITEVDGYKLGFWLPEVFDKVLLDAPCSALGTLYRSPEILKWWGYEKIGKLVRIQRGLILAAYKALKPGGKLMYSTCTLTPEENEGVIQFLLDKHPEVELLDFQIEGIRIRKGREKWKRVDYNKKIGRTGYILPYENNMEGFYLALIRKPIDTK